ncbi:MAG TPA: hypothetical protein VN905_10985 [Candidatus Binatia bacterium]|nr:hypothetical protein [Candidatus Binatia bacterium]
MSDTVQFKPISALVVSALLGFATMQIARADEQSFVPQFSEGSAVHASIVTLKDKYTMDVREDDGYVTTVQLHRGTLIKPLGQTLSPGMDVVITLGSNSNAEELSAAEIDVPDATERLPLDTGPFFTIE